MGTAMQTRFLSVTLAAIAAFVGATPLAQAAGFFNEHPQFPTENGPILTVAGILLFAAGLAVIGLLIRLGSGTVVALQHARTRPAPIVSITLIVCGTLCAICSLWFSWSARSITLGVDVSRSTQSAIQQGSALGPMLLTLLAFLLGSALTAVGIWGSLDTGATLHDGAMKPPVPELAEIPS